MSSPPGLMQVCTLPLVLRSDRLRKDNVMDSCSGLPRCGPLLFDAAILIGRR